MSSCKMIAPIILVHRGDNAHHHEPHPGDRGHELHEGKQHEGHGGRGPAKSVTRVRAINFGKDTRATNVKNYEDATMKGMGVNQTTQGAQLRLARRKYE